METGLFFGSSPICGMTTGFVVARMESGVCVSGKAHPRIPSGLRACVFAKIRTALPAVRRRAFSSTSPVPTIHGKEIRHAIHDSGQGDGADRGGRDARREADGGDG